MIVKVVVPDSIYARVYFARGEQGPQGNTGAQGVQGPTGATGATGAAGTSYTPGDPIYVTVRNATGASMAKGTIVYTSGGNGTHTQVSPALATSDATSARVLGWLAESIANNASGLCQVEGYLDGIDTQGIAEGTQLYVSGTTAGSFQTTKPVAPIHLVYAGVVVKASAGNGRVYVKVQNGYELDEIHDVLISSPANNEVLTYETSTGLWKNKTNPADGVTSITATSPLTGGTITSTGSIGINQAGLTLAQSQITNLVSDLAGTAKLASANTFTVGGHVITPEAVGVYPLTIKAITSQTTQPFRIRNTADNGDLFNIDTSGQVRAPAFLNTNSFNNSQLKLTDTGSQITTGVAGNVPLKVQNTATTPTADLQQWLNTAGTTTLARVMSDGVVRATRYDTNNFRALVGEEASGGFLTLTKATGALSNPSAGNARIYFRDGTNTGTLKLVVRAGTAGAETTILDNIPT